MSDKIQIKLARGYKIFNGGETAAFAYAEAKHLVQTLAGVPANEASAKALDYKMKAEAESEVIKTSENEEGASENEGGKKKRKRRTKAEIEAANQGEDDEELDENEKDSFM